MQIISAVMTLTLSPHVLNKVILLDFECLFNCFSHPIQFNRQLLSHFNWKHISIESIAKNMMTGLEM